MGNVSFEDIESSENTQLTEEEIDNFLTKINEKGVYCPIMAMREPFSKYFVEKTSEDLLFQLNKDADEENISVIHLFLTSRFNAAYEELSIEDLREIASEIQLCYTQDEIEYIENKTREQSSCTLWYRFRAARVTGSVFKKVCRTTIMSPAISTIERICYPERYIFESEHTNYGKRNEPVAREAYAAGMRLEHTNFSIKESGLVINNKYPFCGVTPDGVTKCDCCGIGTVEIKCPSLLRSGRMDSYLSKRECPLVVVNGDNGSWTYELKVGHDYYYQVQMQMFLTDSGFCDFVVWQPLAATIVVRVYKDEPFWDEAYAKASDFFQKVLLPEMLGNYYTQKKNKVAARQ